MNSDLWTKHIEQWKLFLTQRMEEAQENGMRIKAQRQLRAIECVRYGAVLNPALVAEFINPSCTEPQCDEVEDYFLDLNKSQKTAVRKALGNGSLSLIQGPPGTGKTQVITEICLQMYRRNPKVRILVCSETHIAVNNLLARISKYTDDIRILRIRDREQDNTVDEFSPGMIVDTYMEWLRENCKSETVLEIFSQYLSDSEDVSLEKALALSANIVGMTCNRVGAYEFEASYEMFDMVIIDEVCKATLPEILMPLSVAGKAVLVGDPRQLPPVFCSEEIDIIKGIDECNLQEYMYIDKLFEESRNMTILDTQYRMTNQIGNLIGSLFYGGSLKNGRNEEGEDDVVWMDYDPSQKWPVYEEAFGDKQRIYNLDECDLIEKLLYSLDDFVDKGTVAAVIAPYKHQVGMLRRQINKEEFHNLTVNIDTVDGFQGKESDIVIFSLTRTVGSYRFLADERRLNVALSRARDKIFIVGQLSYGTNHRLLRSVSEYSKVIKYKM